MPKRPAPEPMGLGCLFGGLAFAGVFLLAGLGAFYLGIARPYLAIQDAKEWIATPCTIIRSEVVESESDSGSGIDQSTTYFYDIEVEYRYAFEGKEYTSDEYDLFDVSDGQKEWKDEAVAKLPAGTETTCYVDPKQPDHAVLNRTFVLSYVAAVPSLVFIIVGGLGVIFVLIGYFTPDKPPKN